MKKIVCVGLLMMVLVLLLAGCGCEHVWQDATCSAPKTCQLCGETEGEVLAHVWQDATCSAPKTCAGCNATEGEALPHTWQDATCAAPKTCTGCNATEGKVLPHTFAEMTVVKEPNCTQPGECLGDCTVCGAKQVTGEIPTNDVHVFTNTVVREATCTDSGEGLNVCKLCQYSEPCQYELKAHAYGKEEIITKETCTKKGKIQLTCKDCGYSKKETVAAAGHKWTVATCTKAGVCSVCGAKGKKSDHNYETVRDKKPSDTYAGELTKQCKDCGKKVTEYRTKKYKINLNTITSKVAAYAQKRGFKTKLNTCKNVDYNYSIPVSLLDLHARGGNDAIIAEAKKRIDYIYNDYIEKPEQAKLYTLCIYAYYSSSGAGGGGSFGVSIEVTS